ncbi:MAG: tetratricopeptide repeat protein [Vicinamibacterales bacterium]
MLRLVPVILALALASAVPALAQDAAALAAQGKQLQAQGKLDEAETAFRNALAADPASFDASMGLGAILDLKGRYEDARASFQVAIDNAPVGSRRDAVIAVATSLSFEKRGLEAIRRYEEVWQEQVALEETAAAAASANAIGRIALETDNIDAAKMWYERGNYLAHRLAMEIPESELILWDLRLIHAQGRILAREGKADEAWARLDEFDKDMAERAKPDEDRAIRQYLAGYIAYYLKDYNRAIKELQKADLKDPFISNLLAMAYEGKGDRKNAQKYYKLTLESTAHSLQNAFARPIAQAKVTN